MSVPENHIKVGRLAMRQEGDKWNAYYATGETMVGALWLGSIAARFVDRNPERRKAFLDLMREGVSDVIEEATGHRPVWGGEAPAPEHERTKT